MEIGQLFMISKPSFEIKNTTYKLSIQLSLNGFSFCIANSSNQIIVFEDAISKSKEFTEQELDNELRKAFNTKPELQAQFETVEIIYANELYCFVPKKYYNSAYKPLYFKYSVKTLATDYISEDLLTSVSIVNLFIPYVNINNTLIERYNEFNYRHTSSLLLEYILKREILETEKKVYLYFHKNHFDIIVNQGDKLILFNTFNFQTKEDVLYYMLFVMEQLALNPNEIQVILLNFCTNEVYDLLYTYIRNIEKNTSSEDVLIHRLALNL